MTINQQIQDLITPEELFSQKFYWVNQLSGELPESNFITDFIRPAIYRGKNKSVEFNLPDKLSASLIKFTNHSYLSIYLLLVSALGILLRKYTGSNDVIIGSPTYQNAEINENTSNKILPLRLYVDSQVTFKDFLLHVKEKMVSAYSHQDYNFDELVSLLEIPKTPNRCPIFDIAILLENIHEYININNDVTFAFKVTGNSIQGQVKYVDSLFQETTIKTIIKYYLNILEAIISDCYTQIVDISFLKAEDEYKILSAFNNNLQAGYPLNQTINQLFEQQVEQTPNRIAAVFGNLELTYQELNQKANQLARFLQNLGVKQREFVGILKERDINFLIGILAIYKAGGAYVPIDSTYPSDRIKYMVYNSEVKILLTDSSCLNILINLQKDCPHLQFLVCSDIKPQVANFNQLINIDIYDQRDFKNLPQENLEIINVASDPAYMLYTSGSTGLPKGAIVRHDGAINHIYAQFDALELNEDFCFLQSAAASTDISVWQFLAPLLIGGKTVIVDIESGFVPEKLFKVLQEQRITVVELVPAVFGGLIDYISQLLPHQRLLLDLKWMMVVGEPVSVQRLNQWLRIYPSIKVADAYGPTEAADDITQYIVEKPLPESQRTVPIGKPLANLNIYILDPKLNLLPIGVPGEICVAGIGVGNGYWKNEEKTNLSFVANPFPHTTKLLPETYRDLIYKTGDLGRWLPDGNIEFLGRIDHQVKIRGFRVELGEIEALLAKHPAIREAVVILREDIPGEKRLVAYMIVSSDQIPTNDPAVSSELILELRNSLKERLPDYMIPSAFLLLEAFPLSPSGKIDRKALPVPDWSQRNLAQSYIAPRTPTEEMIAGIWSQVLGVEQVGVDDNFFDLGGHSLLATLVVSQLRNVFHIELPLRNIFDFPTVVTLAKSVEIMKQSQEHLQSPPIVPIPRNGKEPLSFAQQRLWFIDQLEPNNPAYNHFNAVRITGALNIVALKQSLNEIIRRHEALRTSFPAADGQPICAIAPALTLELPVVELQVLSANQREAEVLQLAQQEAAQPFDLAQSPLLRAKLLKLDAAEYVLLLTIHHIIFDGWSSGVLNQEIVTLYEAFSSGKPSPLAELSIQYADFAYWQRQWLQGKTLETQLSYWQKQLAGASTSLDLHKIASNFSSTVKIEATEASFLLSPELSEQIKKLSRQEGVTLFMTLLAIFQILLYRYTNQDDIIVGTDVANRNRAEIEPLIGFFVNLLVLRTDLSGNPSFQELLGRVREVTLGAYAHQDLPFAKLVEELRPDRNSSATPLFQVLFVLQNVPMPTVELSDLTLAPMEIDNGLAKFDLALFLAETPSGIVGTWKYNTDLFNAATITRISEHFAILLQSIVAQPDARINTLEMLTEVEKKQQMMEQAKQEQSKLKKFMQVKPKAMKLPQGQLITTDYLQPGETLPLVIKPAVEQIDLIDWVKSHKELIESKLLSHGALLFRGFNIDSPSAFENLAQAICPQLFGEYGDLPREGIGGKVYGSTPYPSDQAILFHNESSHLHCWPLKIWFFCLQSPQVGGETPIVDCRKVYQLLDPKLRSHFEQKQLMYVRNYIQGLDVSWQEFFHTSDRTVVKKYCHQAKIDFEWKEEDHFLTRQVRPAITKHPQTGELIFFNQIQLHHVSCLEPAVKDSLLSTFGAEKLPRNVYYGDGSPIEDAVVEEICSVYEQAKVSFPWQQGDVLMLDNMLTAHGRNPYVGPRKILVAMGEMH
ncbi:MAG: amino acid adenylation domain-containing protein [Trichormus sp. ATA11-4-KO1]|jgi:amino acid adenylation domain-containing protein|nr:amino acid adenylation domain-containing protein [Trichormus sp. ATA11-4-KO1]